MCIRDSGQAVLGFSLLEVVNYLEHYGLLRQRREDGRYERTRPEHSWNSNNVASNCLLYTSADGGDGQRDRYQHCP